MWQDGGSQISGPEVALHRYLGILKRKHRFERPLAEQCSGRYVGDILTTAPDRRGAGIFSLSGADGEPFSLTNLHQVNRKPENRLMSAL
jgi:hypothetical protein